MMVKQSLFCTDFRTDAFCIENTQLLLSKKQPRRGLVLTSSAILLPFTIPVKEYIVPTKKEPRAKYVSTRSLPELFNRCSIKRYDISFLSGLRDPDSLLRRPGLLLFQSL